MAFDEARSAVPFGVLREELIALMVDSDTAVMRAATYLRRRNRERADLGRLVLIPAPLVSGGGT